MMESILTFVWYLVVATPQGGMATMPTPFATREECASAVAAFHAAEPAGDGWVLKCVPSAWDFGGNPFGEPGEEPELPPAAQ